MIRDKHGVDLGLHCRTRPAQLLGLALAHAALVVVASCGWQLESRPRFQLTDLVSVEGSETTGIEREIRSQLRRPKGGGQGIVAQDRWFRIHVSNETMHRRVSASDPDGLAGEFELTLSVEARFSERWGDESEAIHELGQRTFSTTRRFAANRHSVLASEAEQSALATEMRRELASRILEWLIYLRDHRSSRTTAPTQEISVE